MFSGDFGSIDEDGKKRREAVAINVRKWRREWFGSTRMDDAREVGSTRMDDEMVQADEEG